MGSSDQAQKNVEARRKALQEAHSRQALKRKSYSGLDLSSVGSALGAAVQKADNAEYKLMSKWQKVYGGDLIERKDGTHILVNKNGTFYNNGRAINNKNELVNWNINGDGHFSNYKPTVSKPRTGGSKTMSAQKTPTSNSWINKNKGIWNYNGVSQADVANAYKTGDFSKVGSYLSQHRDLASYLNNIYSKRGGNQFNSSTNPTKQATPIQGTPGYGIHVGNDGVTLSTPNGQTTDITNSHNVSTLINNGNYKAPNLGNAATNQLENTPLNSYSKLTEHNFNRSDIRQGMRENGLNPYDYSGSDRKQLRTYLNNPTTDNYTQSVGKIIEDAKIQQNMLNNAVQNQTSQYQLTKPNLANLRYDPSQNNQLVSLKFKQGGQMYKYATGAQMVQPQQASGQQGIEQQAMALVQAAMQGDQQANQTIQKIMQAAQQGDQQAAQVAQLLKAIVQQMKGSRKARLGAKLNYFKQTCECPEGQEVVYFKKGGELCKVCAGKKMQDGGKSDPIKEFKKRRNKKELCKCGAKVATRNSKKKR